MPDRSYSSDPPLGHEHEPDSAPLWSAAQKPVPPLASSVRSDWNRKLPTDCVEVEGAPPRPKPFELEVFCCARPLMTVPSFPLANVPVGVENCASTCPKSGVGPKG